MTTKYLSRSTEMTDSLPEPAPSFSVPGAIDRLCRSAILEKLSKIKTGVIEIRESLDAKPRIFGNPDAASELRARLIVHRARTWSRTLLGGSIGSAESYVEGDWDCENLTALCRIFVANREVLNTIDGGFGAIFSPLHKLLHRFRQNSIDGSKSNIQAHYDLGNDFFELFLDSTWMYSCGIFEGAASSLEDASRLKNDRICRKLDLKPHDRLVEIGTGWGGFAIHAAKYYGCDVTTTTISDRQYELARARIEEEGLLDKIHLLKKDYRELQGRFDKLVSIEMVEAVGLDYLPTYFNQCGELLKPDGQMLIQAIVIQDQYYDQARRSVDFIQKYIFPGSGIPSVSSLIQAAAKKTDMRLFHQEDIGAHYARTLHLWAERLSSQEAEAVKRGYPESLLRLWRFYLAYCEGGFLERSISCAQMLWTKPLSKKAPILGRL